VEMDAFCVDDLAQRSSHVMSGSCVIKSFFFSLFSRFAADMQGLVFKREQKVWETLGSNSRLFSESFLET